MCIHVGSALLNLHPSPYLFMTIILAYKNFHEVTLPTQALRRLHISSKNGRTETRRENSKICFAKKFLKFNSNEQRIETYLHGPYSAEEETSGQALSQAEDHKFAVKEERYFNTSFYVLIFKRTPTLNVITFRNL